MRSLVSLPPQSAQWIAPYSRGGAGKAAAAYLKPRELGLRHIETPEFPDPSTDGIIRYEED